LVDNDEGRFVGEHHSLPVLCRPGFELYAEVEPLFNHLSVNKGFFAAQQDSSPNLLLQMS
jgi:hypothetical protein